MTEERSGPLGPREGAAKPLRGAPPAREGVPGFFGISGFFGPRPSRRAVRKVLDFSEGLCYYRATFNQVGF